MPSAEPEISIEAAFYRKKLLLSLLIPAIFVFLIWLSKVAEILFEADFSVLGIYPLEIRGLPGIILSPFVHESFRHLISNSIPIFILGTGVFYFYSDIALKVSFRIYIFTGLFVWLAGREAWHIGASGLVYGFASFLFFSGIIRKYLRLTALSLLVVFLYGSLVWGMVPEFYRNVSWEGHMLGFVSGILTAIWYRNEGPKPPEPEWIDEDETEGEETGEGETGAEGDRSDRGNSAEWRGETKIQ
jgi:membrane associated rhomboid family serine protease